MPKILLVVLLLFVGFVTHAQSLKNVKYTSETQYLMDSATGDILGEQNSLAEFSIKDDVVIVEVFGVKEKYKILRFGQLENNSFAFQLENDQLLIISEEIGHIIFGDSNSDRKIMCDIDGKTDLETSAEDSDFDQGLYYYENGDFENAISYFTKSAKTGNKMAMNNLGYIYISDDSGQKNTREAINWFEKSSALGDAVAMYNIGLIYDEGDGIDINRVKALKWYKKAANEDYVLAKYNIGYLYYSGEEGFQDYKKAMAWFLKADKQNYPEAGYYIAEMYLYGLGIDQNKSEAIKWFQRSADLGSRYSKMKLRQLR